jgi:ketosteroid isomerase-like protein
MVELLLRLSLSATHLSFTDLKEIKTNKFLRMKCLKKFGKLFVLILMFLFANCDSSRTRIADDSSYLEEARKAIAESNAIYFTSFARNDSLIFIERYAEDACLMPAGVPKTCGKEALSRFFREKYNKGYRGGEFVTVAVYGDGKEYVTEEAIGRIFDKEGKLMSEGKILVLWKKTNKGWKMYRDSFSGDTTPAK